MLFWRYYFFLFLFIQILLLFLIWIFKFTFVCRNIVNFIYITYGWIKLWINRLWTSIKFRIVFTFLVIIYKIWRVGELLVIFDLFLFAEIQFLTVNPRFTCELLFNRMASSLFNIHVYILLLDIWISIKYFLYFIIDPDLAIVFLLFLLQNILLSYRDFCFFNVIIFFWCLFIFILNLIFLYIFIFISSKMFVFICMIRRL